MPKGDAPLFGDALATRVLVVEVAASARSTPRIIVRRVSSAPLRSLSSPLPAKALPRLWLFASELYHS